MHIMHDDDEETAETDPSRAPDLAARIRALRVSLGLSQASFADRIGVDQSNVSRWENGAPPDDAHIVRLADLADQHPAAFRYGRLPEAGPEAPKPHWVSVVGYVGAGQEIFAVDDHAQRDRLHPASRRATLYPTPKQGADLITNQAVEDAACLLGVNKVFRQFPRIVYSRLNGTLGNFMEDDAAYFLAVQ